jgi:hypothetical protein
MTIDTTATPLGANPPTDRHPATAPGQGIVHVHTARRYRHQALCTCGYTGKRRLWRSIAVLDALEHASSCGWAPAVPLITGTTAAPGTPTGGRHARPDADAPDHTERASTNNADGHER